MLFKNWGILLLEFSLEGVKGVGLMIAFQHNKLILHFIVVKSKRLHLGLKIVHCLSLTVQVMLDERKLPWEILLLFEHLSQVPFGLFKLTLPVGSLLLKDGEFLVVGLVLLADLLQMTDQDWVLLLHQGNLVLQWAALLALVQGDGIDDFLQVQVFPLDDFFELVVLVENLLTDWHCVGKLVLKHWQFFPEQVVFLLKSIENGPQLAIEGQQPINRMNLVIDDLVTVGSLILGKLSSEFIDNLIERIGLGTGLYFLKELTCVEFILDFGDFLVVRANHCGGLLSIDSII